MTSPYLETARRFVAQLPPATPDEGSLVSEPSTGGDAITAPEVAEIIPLAAYRNREPLRRCSRCEQPLSVVAVRDVCGRCATPPAEGKEFDLQSEAGIRGQVLLALDRAKYPRLPLDDGSQVGPGLIAWAPVLRELDALQLESLHKVIRRSRPPATQEVEHEPHIDE